MKIEIEKGIPLPGYNQVSRKYPFNEMEVGDSILVNGGIKAETAQNAAHAWAKANKKKFATRKTPDGLRIWRTG